MMRLQSIQALLAISRARARSTRPVVERLADDESCDAGSPCSAAHVLLRTDAARRDHRDRDRARERGGAVEIGPAAHAVIRDFGVDERCDAGVFETARDFDRARVAGFDPALHGDAPAARVDADRDATRPTLRRFAHQRGLAQRGGAEDRALDAERERRFDRRQRAHAAAELHGHVLRSGDDRAHGVAVVRPAGTCSVEIDRVHARRPELHETRRDRPGIVAIHRDAFVVALRKTHAAPAQQVDRRNDLESGQRAISPRVGLPGRPAAHPSAPALRTSASACRRRDTGPP